MSIRTVCLQILPNLNKLVVTTAMHTHTIDFWTALSGSQVGSMCIDADELIAKINGATKKSAPTQTFMWLGAEGEAV